MKNIVYLLLSTMLILTACNAQKNMPMVPNLDQLSEQTQTDVKLIQEYISLQELTDVKATESGLHYIIEKEGEGENPKAIDQVSVHYAGTLMDGTKFDSSYDRGQPATFPLNRVVKGWTEGIPLLKKGGKAKLLIPSELAYGPKSPSPNIPPNSVLLFDVELLEIIKTLSPEEQAKVDQEKIEAYVKEKALKNVEKTPSGIHYIIEKEGTGANPTAADKVKVHYRGTLLNGSEFDSSFKRNQPAEFPLSRVVKGWTEGIPLLKEGGKGTLIIPSALAYGGQARPTIPANSVLIFDVELLEILK